MTTVVIVPGITDGCKHSWSYEANERTCADCLQVESQSGDIILVPPSLACPRCEKLIPDNITRDIADAEKKLKRELTDEDVIAHKNMSLLACPTCALSAMPMPEKVKRATENNQMEFDAPMMEIL